MSKIGIDALHLSCLAVKHIHWYKLDGNSHVSIISGPEYTKHVWNAVSVDMPEKYSHCRCIIISDNNAFYRCIIGARVEHGPFFYSRLQMTVHHIFGENDDNLSRNEYDCHLKYIIDEYLPKTYGIQLSSDNATVDYMEINLDVHLDYPFGRYNRIITLLMSNISRRYGDIQKYTDKNTLQCTSVCRENNSLKIRLYDKLKESKCAHTARETGKLRMEFTLKTANRVDRTFGTRKWDHITQNAVCQAYHKLFEKQFVDPYKKWLQNAQKQVVRKIQNLIIKNGKIIFRRTWARCLIEELLAEEIKNGIPTVLDIEQIESALRLMPDPNRNVHKKIAAIRERPMDKLHVFLQNDMRKAEEIFEKEYQAYKNHPPE